jgi:hypothetical protein
MSQLHVKVRRPRGSVGRFLVGFGSAPEVSASTINRCWAGVSQRVYPSYYPLENRLT